MYNSPSLKSSLNKYYPILVALAIAINLPTLFMSILDQDSSLYASIAKTMVLKHDWLNLYVDGKDWLDKPHFPFWMEAFSMKLLGINSFAYKLPSFLFWLIGGIYVYRTALFIYDHSVAKLSCIIYMLALHGILSNFDVRAEGFLATLTIAAIYHLIRTEHKFSYTHFIAAALVTAMAVMTKGIFIVITIGGGLFWYYAWTGNIKKLFALRQVAFVMLVVLLCFPELYSVYNQFNLHPEKLVFNKHGVSGIRFFLWDSQFGRFFNSGPIKGEGDISFYLHTTLWAFLPWSLLFITAIWNKFRKTSDYMKPTYLKFVTGSALITFLLFSFSKFQLPHYIVILFPQFAIISAAFILHKQSHYGAIVFTRIHTVLFLLLGVAMIGIAWFAKMPLMIVVIAGILATIIIAIFIILKNRELHLIIYGYAFCTMLSIFLFAGLYPLLFKYQAGMNAGRKIAHEYKGIEVYDLSSANSYLLSFYTPGNIHTAENKKELVNTLTRNTPILLYAAPKELDSLRNMGMNIVLKDSFMYYRTTLLTGEFLNPKTRASVVQSRVLATITKP